MNSKPDDAIIKTVREDDFVGVYEIGPLPRGYGHTLGVALRRALLSSIKGWAPTQITIDGISHQFTTIKGVKEDIVRILLNLKKIRVKLLGKDSAVLRIDAKGSGKIKAKDIIVSEGVEILNKDQEILTLSDSKSKFSASILVEPGYGYVPSEDKKTSKVGVILLDSIFSPVLNVKYSVSPDRLGQITGLDKLTLEIETDKTVAPKVALVEVSKILSSFFSRLATGKESVKEDVIEKDSGMPVLTYNPKDVFVDELHLPTRTINALKKAGVKTLADLADMNDEDLLKVRNLGEQSIKEIEKLLKKEKLR